MFHGNHIFIRDDQITDEVLLLRLKMNQKSCYWKQVRREVAREKSFTAIIGLANYSASIAHST